MVFSNKNTQQKHESRCNNNNEDISSGSYSPIIFLILLGPDIIILPSSFINLSLLYYIDLEGNKLSDSLDDKTESPDTNFVSETKLTYSFAS